jgi:hypothetical protein
VAHIHIFFIGCLLCKLERKSSWSTIIPPWISSHTCRSSGGSGLRSHAPRLSIWEALASSDNTDEVNTDEVNTASTTALKMEQQTQIIETEEVSQRRYRQTNGLGAPSARRRQLTRFALSWKASREGRLFLAILHGTRDPGGRSFLSAVLLRETPRHVTPRRSLSISPLTKRPLGRYSTSYTLCLSRRLFTISR